MTVGTAEVLLGQGTVTFTVDSMGLGMPKSCKTDTLENMSKQA